MFCHPPILTDLVDPSRVPFDMAVASPDDVPTRMYGRIALFPVASIWTDTLYTMSIVELLLTVYVPENELLAAKLEIPMFPLEYAVALP